MTDITFNFTLMIIPGPNGGKVEIPGCESESVFSNTTLQTGCCTSHVNVDDILEAIPGTEVITLALGRLGHGTRLLRFPAEDIGGCECEYRTDWYKILKELGCDAPPDQEVTECSTVNFGYCPGPLPLDYETPRNPYLTVKTYDT